MLLYQVTFVSVLFVSGDLSVAGMTHFCGSLNKTPKGFSVGIWIISEISSVSNKSL